LIIHLTIPLPLIPAAKGETTMMKNSSFDNSPEFSRDREFTVVLEDLRTDFRVFGEGLSLLAQRVDGIDNKIEDVRTNQAHTLMRITRIELRMDSMDTRVGSLEIKVDKRFDAVETRLDRLEAAKT